MTDEAAASLVETLRTRAEQAPDAVAYEFAGRSGALTTITYGELAGRASALAARLARHGHGPVLLLYPAGIEYVVAVFACFVAGLPAVPAYPPGARAVVDRDRLAGIVADARPVVAVATEPYPGVPTLAVPGPEADGAPWCDHDVRPSDVAVVQYTSGSTERPRGVLVDHGALAANTAAIAERFGLDPASRGLTWLPPYHDMGLVGGLLTPLAAGFPVRVLPPADFLKAPLFWLHQISASGATISGAPNFAYELCVRRAQRQDALDGLDLSGWRVAFNGAETVRHRTLAAFAERFAPAGFDPAALWPCYGLAEATLIVSAGRWSPGAAGPVGCGAPVSGQRVAVVDPQAATRCPDGREGEIWIAGPHVTRGYRGGTTDRLFAELDGQRYLRTGDLGYLLAGELVPTGRLKDVLVHRGENHHAVDVEAVALETIGPAAGAAAAFLLDADPDPVPVLLVEVRGRPEPALAGRVRAAVLARTRLRLEVVGLVRPRTVPRTSSGKVRRGSCRDALLAGAYDAAVVDDASGRALARVRSQPPIRRSSASI